MADQIWPKMAEVLSFFSFLFFLTMNYQLFIEVAKFCDCSIKLHMQGYLMGHTN